LSSPARLCTRAAAPFAVAPSALARGGHYYPSTCVRQRTAPAPLRCEGPLRPGGDGCILEGTPACPPWGPKDIWRGPLPRFGTTKPHTGRRNHTVPSGIVLRCPSATWPPLALRSSHMSARFNPRAGRRKRSDADAWPHAALPHPSLCSLPPRMQHSQAPKTHASMNKNRQPASARRDWTFEPGVPFSPLLMTASCYYSRCGAGDAFPSSPTAGCRPKGPVSAAARAWPAVRPAPSHPAQAATRQKQVPVCKA
jgi:hypothetical protein